MRRFAFVILIYISLFASVSFADSYTAFSFKIARDQFNKYSNNPKALNCAGITRPVALVYDTDNEDIILVGKKEEHQEPVNYDDWVVAARAILKNRKDPAVSIDRTNETDITKKQKVRFEGGLEDTQFGRDLLDADVILKRFGLGTKSAGVFGLRSYLDLSVEDYEATGKENKLVSRFWFHPLKASSYVTARDGIVVVEEYQIGVQNQIMGSDDNIEQDHIGEKFASDLQNNFSDIKLYFPELARLEQLYYLAALAQGLDASGISKSSLIPYWLREYTVNTVNTPRDYPLEKNSHEFRNVTLEVSGGVSLDTLVIDLQDGVADSIKKYVISSRPDNQSLSWEIPLVSLVWDNIFDPAEIEKIKKAESNRVNFGMNLFKRIIPKNLTSQSLPDTNSFMFKETPPSQQFKQLNFHKPTSFNYDSTPFKRTDPFLVKAPMSKNIGGVMLQGTAKFSGDATVDLSGGSFSFVVDGKNARLSPEAFRKFVTALWSTYYSNQDPGISIDPIAPGAKKHLVRYIGKVMNNDLGRVMREADYIMKKWSVGTARPDIKGFMNPDDYAAKRGVVNVGAWSRFWFVPEDMSFKQGGNMLLFDHGRMTVQTEYMYGTKGKDPANEQFAQFFTDKYDLIAEKYPVYKELFEYSKVVSLAKYLKEKGIPLFWFLMANKDLVITEDSPGTVNALAKGSDYFKGVSIEGGVDLCSEENYIYDKSAVAAIQKAWANTQKKTHLKSIISDDKKISKVPPGHFTFDMGKDSYTVVPQHSLTSGKDRRGIRYQTDLAIRAAGFQLAKESLAKIHDEIVYRKIRRFQIDEIKSRNLKLPLDEDTYNTLYIEGKHKAESKVAYIFDGLKRLENIDYKNEDEFTKDIEKVLGDRKTEEIQKLIMKYAYYKNNLELVRYFNPKQQEEEEGEFGKGWHLLIPYKIQQSGDKITQFRGKVIPEKIALKNLFTGEKEILTFDTERYNYAGHVPKNLKSSQVVGLFLMTDASYRLEDKIGNKFLFNQAGNLTDMIFSEFHQYHIDYLYSFTDAFEESPYRVKGYGEETVEFSDFIAPKRIKVEDVIHGYSEVLVYTDEGNLIGYKPENKETSKYKILAPLTDTSFRLVDKAGNETSFDPIGKFDEMNVSDKNLLVKTITQGNNKIKFNYTIDNSGKVIIAGANLYSGDETTRPRYAINYNYDDDDRLYAVKRSTPRLAEIHDSGQKDKRLAFKGKPIITQKKGVLKLTQNMPLWESSMVEQQ